MKIGEVLTVISAHLAAAEQRKWTGKITFEINMTQGGFGRCYVDSRSELKPIGQPPPEAQEK